LITNHWASEMRGSSTLQTSVADEEILTGNPRLCNLTIIGDTPFILKINGSTNGIYVRANQNLLIPVCNSLKITTNGVTFNWVAQLA
jgi:hypothetical protein